MGSTSGLELRLHPLVIVSISDHHTRIKAQQTAGSGGVPRVIGCLLGLQSGRVVEICNSFELKYDAVSSGAVEIDREFFQQKTEQYKKVFPTYEILGWYSTGSEASDDDMQIHKLMMEHNESPVYLLLDPIPSHTSKDLPITIYESELHVIDGLPSLIFVKSSYTIETVEAERISVDHVARITPTGGTSGATQLTAHLTSMVSAIKMLNSRVKELHTLLVAIRAGNLPYQHSLLRQVASLVQRLPTIDTQRFHDDFATEYNDTLLTSYLASMTKGTSLTNELVEKFNIAYDKQYRRRGFM
eukprot:jgi/Chlat1/7114/Chrsp57S06799